MQRDVHEVSWSLRGVNTPPRGCLDKTLMESLTTCNHHQWKCDPPLVHVDKCGRPTCSQSDLHQVLQEQVQVQVLQSSQAAR